MPASPLHFKQNIFEISRYSEENDYWLLFYFGELVFDSKDQVFKRQICLVNIKESNYCHLRDWAKKKIITLEIREEKTILYSIGTIFNHDGYPVKHPSRKEKHIYVREIVLSNGRNLKKEGLTEFLFNTYFPLKEIEQKIKKDKVHFLYSYKLKSKDEVYVPNALISKYFYYYSSEAIHSIINNRIETGIKTPRIIEGKNTVEFDSDLLNYADAKFIARYCFTTGYEKGIDLLNKSVKNFHKAIANNDKLNLPLVSDIEYFIPFNFALKVVLIGQYIHDDKFMAYDILSIKPYNSTDRFFTVAEFELRDIHDRRSSESRNEKESVRGTTLLGQPMGGQLVGIGEVKPTISSLPKEDLVILKKNFFYDSPKSTFFAKTDQELKYICDKVVIKDYDEYGISNEDTSPDSNTRKVNILNSDGISHFQIFLEALDILDRENDFMVSKLTINGSTQFPYSPAPYYNKDKKSYKVVEEMLIASILNKDRQFIVIDSGPGLRIGIFENYNLPLTERDDDALTRFISVMLQQYHFKWSDVFYDEKVSMLNKSKKQKFDRILQDFRFRVMQPFEHISPKEDDNLAINLVGRIKRRIKESVKH